MSKQTVPAIVRKYADDVATLMPSDGMVVNRKTSTEPTFRALTERVITEAFPDRGGDTDVTECLVFLEGLGSSVAVGSIWDWFGFVYRGGNTYHAIRANLERSFLATTVEALLYCDPQYADLQDANAERCRLNANRLSLPADVVYA